MLSKKKKSKKAKLTSQSGYEIKNTSHGPIVLYRDEVYFLDQGRQLFDIVDENPNFLFDIKDAVIDYIKSNVDDLMEVLSERKMGDAMPTIMALNTAHNYFRFVYHEYPEYRKALAATLLESTEIEASAAINPKEINEFYRIYETADNNKIKHFIKKLEEIQ